MRIQEVEGRRRLQRGRTHNGQLKCVKERNLYKGRYEDDNDWIDDVWDDKVGDSYIDENFTEVVKYEDFY